MIGRALGRHAEQFSTNRILQARQSFADDHADDPLRFHSLTSVLLSTGGDKRIWPDAVTGRNRYGTRMTLADDEISFSSTTATSISRQGLMASSAALGRFIDTCSSEPVSHHAWFDDIRDRIGATFGASGSQVILVASGTDAELIALSLIATSSTRPLTTIVTAPDETGSGVSLAAAGRHFCEITAVGRTVGVGQTIDGIEHDRVKLCQIDIRTQVGAPREASHIDDDLIEAVSREINDDRDVIIHVLDCSKTGLSGVTRKAARHVAELFPGRVRVIVDACQLRCPPSQLRQDLAEGFIVATTGSKYLAGPAFCGALLLPQSFMETIGASTPLAALADYTTAQDWPRALRERFAFLLPSGFNLGLGLRWTAALAHAEGYSRPLDTDVAEIRRQFVHLVRKRVADSRQWTIHGDDDGDHAETSAIVSLSLATASGEPASFDELQNLHRMMREPLDGPICHIGQAVHLGQRSVLRIAASAVDVDHVAVHLARGANIVEAFECVGNRLDAVFEKLSRIQRRMRAT